MNRKNLFHQQISITSVAVVFLGNFSSLVAPVKAQQNSPEPGAIRFAPPALVNRGAPTGRRRGGASRGQCPEVEKPLTALVPATRKPLGEGQGSVESVWGLTVSERPTLWFYVPYSLTPKFPIEFVLNDEQENYVYRASVTVSQSQPGVIKLTLPPTVTLETGRMYHWYFLIDCKPDVDVHGWIRRIPLNPTLASQLQQSTPKERVALYANEGIWYDALTTLAELRIANPQDTSLMNDWASLLQSVGLDAISREPLVPFQR